LPSSRARNAFVKCERVEFEASIYCNVRKPSANVDCGAESVSFERADLAVIRTWRNGPSIRRQPLVFGSTDICWDNGIKCLWSSFGVVLGSIWRVTSVGS